MSGDLLCPVPNCPWRVPPRKEWWAANALHRDIDGTRDLPPSAALYVTHMADELRFLRGLRRRPDAHAEQRRQTDIHALEARIAEVYAQRGRQVGMRWTSLVMDDSDAESLHTIRDSRLAAGPGPYWEKRVKEGG